jgi:hypothetical protein
VNTRCGDDVSGTTDYFLPFLPFFFLSFFFAMGPFSGTPSG